MDVKGGEDFSVWFMWTRQAKLRQTWLIDHRWKSLYIIVVPCLLIANSLVTFSQMEKNNEGIRTVYPKVQSSGFMIAELLPLITKRFWDSCPFSLFSPRGRAETSYLE